MVCISVETKSPLLTGIAIRDVTWILGIGVGASQAGQATALPLFR